MCRVAGDRTYSRFIPGHCNRDWWRTLELKAMTTKSSLPLIIVVITRVGKHGGGMSVRGNLSGDVYFIGSAHARSYTSGLVIQLESHVYHVLSASYLW